MQKFPVTVSIEVSLDHNSQPQLLERESEADSMSAGKRTPGLQSASSAAPGAATRAPPPATRPSNAAGSQAATKSSKLLSGVNVFGRHCVVLNICREWDPRHLTPR